MTDVEIPDRLVDDIVAGDCVAFVGAGFTAPVLPEWRLLLVELAEEADEHTAEGCGASSSRGPTATWGRPPRP